MSYKDRNKVVQDLKDVYQSGTLEGAEAALLCFGEKWNRKYPAISEMWMRNWENLITIYSYPEEIRRVIYTTNAIESLNSVIKGRIRKHRIFSSDESALKAVWMTIIPSSKKWTMPVSNWKAALNYFYVKFVERLILIV